MPDFGAQRWSDAVTSFRILIERNALHKWIANAFLAHPPNLVPMTVFRGETLEDNLRHVLSLLSENEREAFWPAITHATQRGYWPPKDVPAAWALQDLLRVARLTGHFGMLGWAANQIQDLLRQPITWTDLKALLSTIVFFEDLHDWVPDANDDGPVYYSLLRKMYEIFAALKSKRNLSFFDAALLAHAVRYDTRSWPALVCDAIRRYDTRKERLFPADWPMFGGDNLPEGCGLYDLRAIIRRIVSDMSLIDFVHGMRTLGYRYFSMDDASFVLIQILLDEKLIERKLEIFPPDNSELPEGAEKKAQANAQQLMLVEPTPAFSLGYKYFEAANMGQLRRVTFDMLKSWSDNNWALVTAAHKLSSDTARTIVAHVEGTIDWVFDYELANYPASSDEEEPNTRSFGKFQSTGVAAHILSRDKRN